jgi:hypothetical protein
MTLSMRGTREMLLQASCTTVVSRSTAHSSTKILLTFVSTKRIVRLKALQQLFTNKNQLNTAATVARMSPPAETLQETWLHTSRRITTSVNDVVFLGASTRQSTPRPINCVTIASTTSTTTASSRARSIHVPSTRSHWQLFSLSARTWLACTTCLPHRHLSGSRRPNGNEEDDTLWHRPVVMEF